MVGGADDRKTAADLAAETPRRRQRRI